MVEKEIGSQMEINFFFITLFYNILRVVIFCINNLFNVRIIIKFILI